MYSQNDAVTRPDELEMDLDAKAEGSRVQLMSAAVSKPEVSSLALVVAEQ